MGKMTIYISDELEKEFRNLVRRRYGERIGALSIMAEEAIKKYLRSLPKDESLGASD